MNKQLKIKDILFRFAEKVLLYQTEMNKDLLVTKFSELVEEFSEKILSVDSIDKKIDELTKDGLPKYTLDEITNMVWLTAGVIAKQKEDKQVIENLIAVLMDTWASYNAWYAVHHQGIKKYKEVQGKFEAQSKLIVNMLMKKFHKIIEKML